MTGHRPGWAAPRRVFWVPNSPLSGTSTRTMIVCELVDAWWIFEVARKLLSNRSDITYFVVCLLLLGAHITANPTGTNQTTAVVHTVNAV